SALRPPPRSSVPRMPHMLVPQSPPSALQRVALVPFGWARWFRYSTPPSTRPYISTLDCACAVLDVATQRVSATAVAAQKRGACACWWRSRRTCRREEAVLGIGCLVLCCCPD